jgi:hypothetical protein
MNDASATPTNRKTIRDPMFPIQGARAPSVGSTFSIAAKT